MNKNKVILFAIILIAAFICTTAAAFFAKPELNKPVIFRLMK